MDIFRGWENFEEKLKNNWLAVVKSDDTVVIPGDITWGMTMETALPDFKFIDALPGTKIIMKGNHDYWWSTKKKAETFFENNGIKTIKILNNNAYSVGALALCGTRGWMADSSKPEDRKIVLREAARLKMSIDCAKSLGGEPIAFLHYPPMSGGKVCEEIVSELIAGGVKRCYYGHLHGAAASFAPGCEMFGIKFKLVSSDYLGFCPKLVEKF